MKDIYIVSSRCSPKSFSFLLLLFRSCFSERATFPPSLADVTLVDLNISNLFIVHAMLAGEQQLLLEMVNRGCHGV